jgi:undecaprenyl-diphosphatase
MIPLDRHIERWVVHHRAGFPDDVFVALSRVGTLGLVWVAIALLLALVWRRPGLFFLVVAADSAADLLALALKRLVDTDRPPIRYPEPHALVRVPQDHSFPSGHAATSFACATVLASFAPRLAVPLYLLAAAIAYSRVYVGVHYPLDVLAGALLGVGVATALLKLVRVRRRSPPAPRPG